MGNGMGINKRDDTRDLTKDVDEYYHNDVVYY
jgi:hypothetical protein